MAKKNARKSRTARPVKRPAARKARKSKFPVTASPVKRKFGNRFEKFYYTHRNAINAFRRSAYKAHKGKGVCVKCKQKRVKGSIFCNAHRRMSRIYNKRRS